MHYVNVIRFSSGNILHISGTESGYEEISPSLTNSDITINTGVNSQDYSESEFRQMLKHHNIKSKYKKNFCKQKN